MSKLISKLPVDIKMIALGYRDTKTDKLACAFNWSETREGYEIWEDINYGNYQSFYDLYNIKKENEQELTPKQWCEEKGYNEYHVMIIEQYLNDMKFRKRDM